MNDKTDGGRLARRAVGVAAVAGVCLLSAACGLVHVSANSPSGSASATAGSATADYRADLAYAQCMQTHGDPSFPDPQPGQQFGVSTQRGTGSAGKATTPEEKASVTCGHLLPKSQTSGNSGVSDADLAAALKISECLRAHGEPTFPDPTVVNGSINYNFQAVNTAKFQAAVSACQSVIPKGVTLP
ncbi:MAG: hypothetical protein ABSA93_07100 [Streptosporangiaceae bacterium]|jgi:hypothetical protein